MKSANSTKVAFRDIIDGIKVQSTVKLTDPYDKGEKLRVQEVDEQMNRTGKTTTITVDECVPVECHINGVASKFKVKYHNG